MTELTERQKAARRQQETDQLAKSKAEGAMHLTFPLFHTFYRELATADRDGLMGMCMIGDDVKVTIQHVPADRPEGDGE